MGCAGRRGRVLCERAVRRGRRAHESAAGLAPGGPRLTICVFFLKDDMMIFWDGSITVISFFLVQSKNIWDEHNEDTNFFTTRKRN